MRGMLLAAKHEVAAATAGSQAAEDKYISSVAVEACHGQAASLVACVMSACVCYDWKPSSSFDSQPLASADLLQ